MAWNGGGVFSRLYSWVTRAAAGLPDRYIDPTTIDAEFNNYTLQKKTSIDSFETKNKLSQPWLWS